MAQIVKVRIVRGETQQLQYPKRYNAVEVDRHGLSASAFGGPCGHSGGIGMGQVEEYCLILMPDDLAAEYAADPDMEIVDAATADTLMEQWRIDQDLPEETVGSESRLIAIRAKQEAGIALSAEDLQALDPASPVPGINRTRRPVAETLGRRGKHIGSTRR